MRTNSPATGSTGPLHRRVAVVPGLVVLVVTASLVLGLQVAAPGAAAPAVAGRPAAVGSSPTPGGLPAYSSSIRRIGPTLAERMSFSWRSGCPVPLRRLRYLQLTYYGFDAAAHEGELVVHRRHARAVVAAFRDVYQARFPIRRMRLVDDYEGSDDRSMAANNTSAFNCRRVTGGTAWSQHSYGWAIDINPVQNPYVNGAVVEPARGSAYVQRQPVRKGMVTRAVRRAFAAIGWEWGGRWNSLKDYMHFSANNR